MSHAEAVPLPAGRASGCLLRLQKEEVYWSCGGKWSLCREKKRCHGLVKTLGCWQHSCSSSVGSGGKGNLLLQGREQAKNQTQTKPT